MTKPYYQSPNITLYLGDCADLQITCDLLITDPPYGKDFKSNRATNFKKIVGDEKELAIAINDRIKIALSYLRPFRHSYIFNGNGSLKLNNLPLGGITELIWDKENIGTGDLSSPWGPQHEKILFGVYVPSKANRERGDGRLAARLRKGSVIRSLRANSRRAKLHPNEKPIDILRQLIESSSCIGDTVYDPFSGSGSTLLAALKEERKAIGCEIEEKFCELTVKRLKEYE